MYTLHCILIPSPEPAPICFDGACTCTCSLHQPLLKFSCANSYTCATTIACTSSACARTSLLEHIAHASACTHACSTTHPVTCFKPCTNVGTLVVYAAAKAPRVGLKFVKMTELRNIVFRTWKPEYPSPCKAISTASSQLLSKPCVSC